MEYYLGIDIGTTSVKSIAFSKDGKSVCEHSISYPIQHVHPDWSAQDPEEILRALIKTVENILHDLSPYVPVLCCFSSAMHSLIAVNESGAAISPSIIWADNRAAGIAKRIHQENRAKELYDLTGLPVHAMSPFCKLQWMKENQPELFVSAHKFIGIKEYIFYQLFGMYVVDYSVAAATGLMNRTTLQWDPQLMQQCGLGPEKLSEIVATDKIFYAARLFPVLHKVPFIIGGSDGAMANLGTTEDPGALVITIGTSSAARIIVQNPYLDPAMRTFCYFIKNNQWLIGGASNNGGIVLQWLHEEFFRSKEDLSVFLTQAEQINPGSDGLIFLPYLLGERAPHWNAEAKGVLFGLTAMHGQAAMIRASMEGIIYCLYSISQPLLALAEIKNIYASGGFARNVWGLQILADVFNLPVRICETIENSAWGAAKYGMQVLDISVSAQPDISNTFYPDRHNHELYTDGFRKFQRLYELLRSEFT